jgi:hypothetical protein
MKDDNSIQRLLPPGYRERFVIVPRGLTQRVVVSTSIMFTGIGLSLGAAFATPQLANWGFAVGLFLAVGVHAFMRRCSRNLLDRNDFKLSPS